MKFLCSLISFGLLLQVQGGVVINEFMAASSDRLLSWSTNDVPHLGSGVPWQAPEYVDSSWSTGNLPAGYGFPAMSTDLTAAMSNQAPSLYLRKEFQVTTEQASSTNQLNLPVDCDDGFVAYINGHEVARANCGPDKPFPVRQPASLQCPHGSRPDQSRPGLTLAGSRPECPRHPGAQRRTAFHRLDAGANHPAPPHAGIQDQRRLVDRLQLRPRPVDCLWQRRWPVAILRRPL